MLMGSLQIRPRPESSNSTSSIVLLDKTAYHRDEEQRDRETITRVTRLKIRSSHIVQLTNIPNGCGGIPHPLLSDIHTPLSPSH